VTTELASISPTRGPRCGRPEKWARIIKSWHYQIQSGGIKSHWLFLRFSQKSLTERVMGAKSGVGGGVGGGVGTNQGGGWLVK